jgi:hypothetical protein
MRALITKGKNRGNEVEIIQWCNDWFSVEDEKGIYGPLSLAFTVDGYKEISNHKNNGMLFFSYQWALTPPDYGKYVYTFKRNKIKKKM